MNDEQKRLWIYEQAFRASDAIATLDAAKRQAASAYDSRIRKLTAFAETLRVKNADSQQLELFDPREVLSKEIEALLTDPLGGL